MTYKHGNGRIEHRAGNGQFRRTTLAQDFNTGTRVCPECGSINPYTLKEFKRTNGFVEMVRNPPPEVCNGCGHRFEDSE